MYSLRYKFPIILFWLIFSTLLIHYSIDYLYLSNDNLFYQSFGEQLAADRIEKMIELSRKWQWMGYFLIPLLVLIRISFTSTCIYIGCFFADLIVHFGKLFKIAVLADFVFVLAGLVKVVILIFFKGIDTMDDLQFQPLSLLELFDRKSLEPFFIYPFAIISIFELLYWLILAWLLSDIIDQPFTESLKTVSSSYGAGLALWVLFTIFLTINLT